MTTNIDALHAIKKALDAYRTDMESDDVEFTDAEVIDHGDGTEELFVYIDGESFAITAEVV